MNAAADLKTRIDADMKAAMRAREKVRLGALRLLLAAIKQKEVDERITLDDTQVLAIIEKLSKQRRDSIEQFEKAGRTELAEQERAELAVLDTYRPAQADEAQISAVIEAAMAETGATGMADMGWQARPISLPCPPGSVPGWPPERARLAHTLRPMKV